MKLLHCHIENFGKLHDMDLDFRGGLHTIREENGWGKSTLAAFLLVMFYGFGNERKRSALENERRRYAPWQTGVYGGSVTFSHKGDLYRIERIFGIRDAAEDQMYVYNAETNLPAEGFSERPGEELFSIDRDSFCRTVFIAQQDCKTEATPGIQAKIGRLEGEQGDIAEYKDVQAMLKKEADALTPYRKTGELSRLASEIAGLEEEIRRRPDQEEALARLEDQLAAQEQKRADLEQELQKNTEQLRQFSVSRRTAEDLSLDDEDRIRLQELQTVFAEGVPEEEDLEEAEERYENVRRLQAECERLRLNGRKKEKKEKEKPTKRNGSSPIAALAFTLFVCGLMCFFFNRILMIPLIGAAVLIMILTSIHDKKTGDDEVEVIIKDRVRFPWPEAGSVLEAQELEREKRAEIAEEEEELREFLRQYYPDFSEEDDLSRKLQQLQYDKKDYLSLIQKEEKARTAREEYRQSRDDMRQMLWKETQPGQKEFSYDAIREAIDRARTEALQLDRRIPGTQRQIEDARAELDSLNETEDTLEELRQKMEEKQHRYNVICRTSEYLSRARASFTARYMEPVKESFDAYYAMISGGDEKEYMLDADLNITARECGAQRDTGFLSEGYQDLVGLCRRMAMIDAMYTDEKPFLLFDDPFVNLDGRKLEKALRFLRQISEKYQVIYFTCHDSRTARGQAGGMVPDQ